MKILLIANMYPDEKTLMEAKLQPGVFIFHQVKTIEEQGIEIIKAVKVIKNPLGYFPFMIESFYKLLICDYDIVHAHYVPHSALIPAIMKWIRKKPLIVTFHGDDARIYPWKNFINRMLTLFVINRSDSIIARSDEMKSVLIKLGCPDHKISVIGAGVDTSVFRPLDRKKARNLLGLPADKQIILYVGRLHKMKGVRDLYECAMRMPEVQFVIVGDGEEKTNQENCIFMGEKKHEDLPLWMSSADILALPSYSEGLPNVVMEALSCGTPAVVTNVGGCPELVKDDVTGKVINVKDINALENSFRYLINNEEIRLGMGIEGRKDMIKRYDHLMLMKRLVDVYKIYAGKR